MKRENVVKAVEDLNIILGLDPAIDTDEMHGITALKRSLKEGALWLVATDDLEDNTVDVLKTLNWTKSDFTKLKKDQDPLPAFYRYGIIEDEAKVEEDKPIEVAKKPRKKRASKKKEEEAVVVEEVSAEPEAEAESETVEEAVEEVAEDPVREGTDESENKAEPARPNPSVSAYSTAIALMGPDPTLPISDLYVLMQNQGFDIASATGSIKTAHSTFRRCYHTLKINGWIKEN